jgi:hypothetical protein
MARSILNEYGPDADKPQAPSATSGGCTEARDVMGYAPPVGPIGISNNSVGLGGTNVGNAGSQGKSSLTGDGGAGTPGIGGQNEGEEGSQHG